MPPRTGRETMRCEDPDCCLFLCATAEKLLSSSMPRNACPTGFLDVRLECPKQALYRR